MKRRIFSILLAAVLLTTSSMAVFAGDVKVMVNNYFLDTQGVIIDGHTLLPVRALGEAVGAEVEWNGETRQVTLIRDDITILMTIDDTTVYINGVAESLTSPAIIIEGRTFLPLRFIGNSLGFDVSWAQETLIAFLWSADNHLTMDEMIRLADQDALMPVPQVEQMATPQTQEHTLTHRYPTVTRHGHPLTTIDVIGSKGTVQTISYTSQLRRNEEGRVQLIGQPLTTYNLGILSAAGNALTANGLGNTGSNDDGFVLWDWLVGGGTGFGTQNATITVNGETFRFQIEIIPSEQR